jgi:broad specificity phosphatase PhoE
VILIFVRHGRGSDVDGRCIGQTDVALSSEGAVEIERLASDWREHVVGAPAAIYSSDLRRARESAEIVGAVWGIPVQYDHRLREMHFGAWDGQRWDAIEAADGARLRAWTERWADTAAPGGETIADIERRAADWIDETLRSPVSSSGTVVVVSHAGWIRVALSRLLRRPASQMFDIPVDYARATVVRVDEREARLLTSNVERLRMSS